MSRFRDMLLEGESDKFGTLPISKVDLALIELLSTDTKIKDHRDIHSLAEKLGLDPPELEEKAYALLQSFWSKGRANKKKFNFSDADPKEVKMGIEVEYEHTDNKYVAYRISMDHLAELPDYYTRLSKMEKEGGVKG